MKTLLIILITIFSYSAFNQTLTQSDIDTNYYKSSLNYLASDELEGRKPGTKGGDLAAEYIASQFKLFGLSQISEGEGYMQMVPFVEMTADYSSMKVVINSDNIKDSLKAYDEVLFTSQVPKESLTESAELVFAGYGIVAPEYDWDDFKGFDVTGKILLMLYDDPDYEISGFGSEGQTYYSSFEYKEKAALLRGAKGLIIIHSLEFMGFPFEVIQNFVSAGVALPANQKGEQLKIHGFISKTGTDRILEMKGYNLDKLKTLADSRDFQPIFLGLKAEISFNQKIRNFESPNIIGILPGTEKKNEAVLFSAHYDHLGIGKPVNGDSIYNGAEDNASGTAALLTLAKSFSSNPPKRTIIFLATTGEENFFIGAKYYVKNPVIPLENTISALNMDGMTFLGKRDQLYLHGIENTDAVDEVEEVVDMTELKLNTQWIDKYGKNFRCDHYVFNMAGVPAFTMGLGGKFLTRDMDEIMNIRKEYGNSYHMPKDEVYPWFSYDGVLQYLVTAYNLGTYFANTERRPSMLKDNIYIPAIKMYQAIQQ
jgi:Zn-dependent M28 family amino/carboxypeptidase